jgi:hypothetical protein
VEGGWDTILFHHSLEHMPAPVETLRRAAGLLAPGGVVLVGIPTVSCRAWRQYGVHWVQLDAPRHLFVPSRPGLSRMAEAAGLSLRELVDCSTSYQFWGSEQVRRGISMIDPRSFTVDPQAGTFTPAELSAWEGAAREANARGEGDQGLVYQEAA